MEGGERKSARSGCAARGRNIAPDRSRWRAQASTTNLFDLGSGKSLHQAPFWLLAHDVGGVQDGISTALEGSKRPLLDVEFLFHME